MSRRLLFVVNEASFFLSHRLPLALAARARGYDVHVATRPGEAVARLVEFGLAHHALEMSRSGRNPLAEIRTLVALFTLFRRLNPGIVHLVTIKPVLYGGIAARLAGVPGIVAAVSGLGFVFTSTGVRATLLRTLVRKLYRFALGNSHVLVIFQNKEDRRTMVEAGIVECKRTRLIRGSGVDLEVYRARPEPGGDAVVVMASRLLRDKGVVEFVEAARQVARQWTGVRFQLVGEADPGNPTSVPNEELTRWRSEGNVELTGHRSDMPDVLAAAHVVVLPSYREGLPKVLLEAAACGRAVVTTDVPGCRDAIQPGVTGLLVPPRDASTLANAILALLRDSALRRAMGTAGRALAERDFGLAPVVDAHLHVYHELGAKTAAT